MKDEDEIPGELYFLLILLLLVCIPVIGYFSRTEKEVCGDNTANGTPCVCLPKENKAPKK